MKECEHGQKLEAREHWVEAFEEIQDRIHHLFPRSEPRERAIHYIKGLLSPIERKNSWQLAEASGESNPYGIQHLLGKADWNPDALRDDLIEYVGEHFGDPDGVIVVDETGFLKKGKHSAGVARQYSGTAGRIENCQIGVFAAYVTSRDHILIDRELYLPKEWTEDSKRRAEVGISQERMFLTKPKLARVMIERIISSGLAFKWASGDSVYGDDRSLRLWLEDKGKAYVFAVSGKEYVFIGFNQYRVSEILDSLPREGWMRMSAGDGSKGPRMYDWFLIGINPPLDEGWKRWLLVRRSVHDPQELKAHVVCAPAGTKLVEMVRVAGIRWAVEVSFEDAKQETGLDEYEVRSFTGWYRHITLSLFAYALLCTLKRDAREAVKKKQPVKKGSLARFKEQRGLRSP
jgi:SRSO17 transposase